MTTHPSTQAGQLKVRKSEERGLADFGWLKSRHSFSFGAYQDSAHMGYRTLRVINDDRVAADMGFGTHPHRDMEIISYVVEGALAHQDSMGNGSEIAPGDVQRMSAGTGVTHSEFNPSATDGVHFLQIWIQPEQAGMKPGYEQRRFDRKAKLNRLRLIGSHDGREDSVVIHQDVNLYASVLETGRQVQLPVDADRHLWVQVISGRIRVNGTNLNTGDGAAIEQAESLSIDGVDKSEFLVFDLG